MSVYKVTVTADGRQLQWLSPTAENAIEAISKTTFELYDQIKDKKRLTIAAEPWEKERSVPNVTEGG